MSNDKTDSKPGRHVFTPEEYARAGRKKTVAACTPDELKALIKETGLTYEHVAKMCRRALTTLYLYTGGQKAVPEDVVMRLKEIAKWTNGRLRDDDYTAICMNYLRVHRM